MSSSSTPRYLIAPILEEVFEATIPTYSSKMVCPFHEDTHPSAWFNQYYFKCMACGVHGDAIGLLHYQGGLSFKDAYERAEAVSGKPDEPVRGGAVASSILPGGSGLKRGSSRYSKTRSGS